MTSPDEIAEMVRDVVRSEISRIASLFRTDEPGTHKGKYLTKREAASIARISVRTVENRMKSGVYRFTKEGRKVLIMSEDVYSSLTDGLTDNRFS